MFFLNMKKGAILFLIFGIFLIGISSAIPYILFVNPTPSDNYETTSDSFEINSSITNLSGLEELIFNWDGTNYTFYNNSLVLMMNFENNSGLGENDSFVRDLSKYENNGTVFGAIFNLAGRYRGAYSFSGRDKITIANSASLNITDNLTISLWAKRNNVVVKQVSVGKLYSCVLTEKGDVYCWGENIFGQLGTGNFVNSLSPKLVLGGHNFSSISAGFCHICALNTTGSAFCWGYNGEGSCEYGEIGYGGLGIGNTTNMNTPQLVLGGNNFNSISAGWYYTCALNTTGSAYCWGDNIYGQLGIGNTTSMYTPQSVLGGNTFTLISSGTNHHQHTCAINTTGSAFCWGENLNGQLGIGNTTQMNAPQRVLGGDNFSSISCASSNTCAINTTGSAYCWGRGDFGGVGIGNTTTMHTPQLVVGNLNFTSIISGEHHSCGLNGSGSAFCWGENIFGELGIGNVTNYMYTPQLVLGGYNFTSISSHAYHVCGITINKEVYCWGYNVYGQLGTGFSEALYPKPIVREYNFSLISAGKLRTCALESAGNIYCWGDNSYGGLGIGNTTNMNTPQLVLGDNNFSLVSLGYSYNCALNTTGSAYCWGDNYYGGLGIGNTTDMYTPQLVLGGHNFSSISAGFSHNCALNTTGSAFCWGDNQYGGLGIGNVTTMYTPQLVSGGHNFTKIVTGYKATCAINTTGGTYCWGYNGYGELGIGNTTNMPNPQRVLGGNNFTSIYSKLYTVCALNTTGSAFCWGYGGNGGLGIGNTSNMNTPQRVLGGYIFSKMGLGAYHTCAINTTGSAYCWGYNTFGQLGNGNVTTMYTPQNVLREYNFTSIDGGYPHTCATTTIGTTYCWGSNACGQTGIGRASVLFPSYKAIKSVLIGKSVDSFLIGETFGGTIVSILNQNPVEFGTPSGWVNILLSYNQTADLYLNGTLVNNSAYIQIDSDPSVITIGENFDGTIDEIRILNRTVLASEVQQFYKSNLKKINETSWEFYSNQSLDSEKTYSYFLFAKDSVSSYRLLRNIIKFPFSEEDLFSDSSSGIFKPTQKQLKEGYVKILTKKQKVQVNLSNGEQYLAEIKEVNKILEKVVVSIGGNNYSIAKNSSEKIDLNNDGYYDLQVSVTQIYITGYAKVEFKEIHEEISQENKESVTESAVDNNEDAVSNKNKLIYYVLGFVILVLIISLIILKSLKKNL